MIQCAITLVFPFLYALLWINPVKDPGLEINQNLVIQKTDTITIGLLLESAEADQDAIQAAQLAVNVANKSGDNQGTYFNLVHRATEGPWGQASNKCVELIFEEKAVAIVGSLNGRTAHLAEQVIAKSHIPYLETKATDATLSKAFVPWFFRLVPNDQQISVALAENIYYRNKYAKVAVLSDHTYDSKKAVETFNKVIAEKHGSELDFFSFDNQNSDLENSLTQLQSENYDAIVLFVQSTNQPARLVKLLEETESSIYLSRYPTYQNPRQTDYPFHTISVVANQPKYEKFILQFQSFSERTPTVQAVVTYDAINLLIQAIITKGAKPEIIGKQIGTMDDFDGISGRIDFDDHGNLTRRIEFIHFDVINK